jgi:hypothetical protein
MPRVCSIASARWKSHQDAMRAIRNLECSTEYRLRLNFEESSWINKHGKPQ